MDGLDRYARMAERAKERTRQRKIMERTVAQQRAMDHGGAPDQLDGEGPLLDHDEHFGHRTHINFLHHGNGVMCSCGSIAGCFSYILPTEEEYDEMRTDDPGYCPICRARGVEPPHAANAVTTVQP